MLRMNVGPCYPVEQSFSPLSILFPLFFLIFFSRRFLLALFPRLVNAGASVLFPDRKFHPESDLARKRRR